MKTFFKLFLSSLFCLVMPLMSGASNDDEAIEWVIPEQKAEQKVEQARKEGEPGYRMVLTINNVEFPFRWCPPGTFMMGSPASEQERGQNETQHQVTLSRGFWMLETEVTLEMWGSVMGNSPNARKGEKFPVETVSWNNCLEYVQKLDGLNVAPADYRFALPTEAQWEYACRAGTTTPFSFGMTIDRDNVNFGKNLGKTMEVGSYPANAWGLHDMHGNVWEWCMDWYGVYPVGDAINPEGASSGSNRVLRGGGWFHVAGDCRSAVRRDREPSVRNNAVGLRLALIRVE